jgi:soluble lytic murein transglycosylase-like protein
MRNGIYGPQRPIVNLGKDRIESLKNNTPAIFEIHERRFPVNLAKRNSMEFLKQGISESLTEKRTLPEAGKKAVQKYDEKILQYGQKHNVDPDLIRAVMYAENARGFYGNAADSLGISKTALPMNVHKKVWIDLLDGKPKDLYNPDINIETGAVLLKRISSRIEKPIPEKVSTLWNSAPKEYISEFGNYVGEVYRKKPWRNID